MATNARLKTSPEKRETLAFSTQHQTSYYSISVHNALTKFVYIMHKITNLCTKITPPSALFAKPVIFSAQI